MHNWEQNKCAGARPQRSERIQQFGQPGDTTKEVQG
jgi:hypothetical protein